MVHLPSQPWPLLFAPYYDLREARGEHSLPLKEAFCLNGVAMQTTDRFINISQTIFANGFTGPTAPSQRLTYGVNNKTYDAPCCRIWTWC